MAEEKKKKTIHKSPAPKARPAAAKKKKTEAPAPAAAGVEKKVFVPRKPKPAKAVGPRYYGTGRRKEATAKVWLTPGSGKLLFNGRSLQEYFGGRKILELMINRPFAATQTGGTFDASIELLGGGVSAQADAVRMGIARALVAVNAAFKPILKKEGLLTRDPRMKERKKYGLKRARRAFQYTKR